MIWQTKLSKTAFMKCAQPSFISCRLRPRDPSRPPPPTTRVDWVTHERRNSSEIVDIHHPKIERLSFILLDLKDFLIPNENASSADIWKIFTSSQPTERFPDTLLDQQLVFLWTQEHLYSSTLHARKTGSVSPNTMTATLLRLFALKVVNSIDAIICSFGLLLLRWLVNPSLLRVRAIFTAR